MIDILAAFLIATHATNCDEILAHDHAVFVEDQIQNAYYSLLNGQGERAVLTLEQAEPHWKDIYYGYDKNAQVNLPKECRK